MTETIIRPVTASVISSRTPVSQPVTPQQLVAERWADAVFRAIDRCGSDVHSVATSWLPSALVTVDCRNYAQARGLAGDLAGTSAVGEEITDDGLGRRTYALVVIVSPVVFTWVDVYSGDGASDVRMPGRPVTTIQPTEDVL